MSKYLYTTVYEQFTGEKPPEPTQESKIRRRRSYGHPYRMRLSGQEDRQERPNNIDPSLSEDNSSRTRNGCRSPYRLRKNKMGEHSNSQQNLVCSEKPYQLDQKTHRSPFAYESTQRSKSSNHSSYYGRAKTQNTLTFSQETSNLSGNYSANYSQFGNNANKPCGTKVTYRKRRHGSYHSEMD